MDDKIKQLIEKWKQELEKYKEPRIYDIPRLHNYDQIPYNRGYKMALEQCIKELEVVTIKRYRLIKEKISHLTWLDHSDTNPEILVCFGFNDSPNTLEINVLPDVVEEYVPKGIIEFDDWEETVNNPFPNDFFFKSEKIVMRKRSYPNNDRTNTVIYESKVVEKPHFVCVNRNCLELL